MILKTKEPILEEFREQVRSIQSGLIFACTTKKQLKKYLKNYKRNPSYYDKNGFMFFAILNELEYRKIVGINE